MHKSEIRKLFPYIWGVEIECYIPIKYNNKILKLVRKNYNFTTTRDLSLHSNYPEHRGIELVSPKLNYKSITKIINLFKELERLGAIVDDTCGLHININDNTKFNTRKLLRSYDFIDDCKKVGRPGNSFCLYRETNLTEKFRFVSVRPGGRLEYRIFDGTVNWLEFLSNLSHAQRLTKKIINKEYKEDIFTNLF
jgi:hypothetical protein